MTLIEAYPVLMAALELTRNCHQHDIVWLDDIREASGQEDAHLALRYFGLKKPLLERPNPSGSFWISSGYAAGDIWAAAEDLLLEEAA